MEIPKFVTKGRFRLESYFIYEEDAFTEKRVVFFINDVKFTYNNSETKLSLDEIDAKIFSGEEFICSVFLASSSRDQGEFLDFIISIKDGLVEMKKYE